MLWRKPFPYCIYSHPSLQQELDSQLHQNLVFCILMHQIISFSSSLLPFWRCCYVIMERKTFITAYILIFSSVIVPLHQIFRTYQNICYLILLCISFSSPPSFSQLPMWYYGERSIFLLEYLLAPPWPGFFWNILDTLCFPLFQMYSYYWFLHSLYGPMQRI